MKISLTLATYFFVFTGILSQLAYIMIYQHNPERNLVTKLNPSPYTERFNYFYKIGLHLHSDSVYYTPERHSKEEILIEYKKQNYDLISISDYNQITGFDDSRNYLNSYEWGRNFRKRHMLVLGTEFIPPNMFILSTFLSNIQYAINQLIPKNAFIVVSHPNLYDAFTKEDLLELEGYHAIEVFSPYGDTTEKWDYLLTHKGQVYCSSGDDLHYFPEEIIQKLNQPLWKDVIQQILLQRNRESEAFLRYVVVNAESLAPEHILNSLLKGNYFCIKKLNRHVKDVQIPEISIQQKAIKIQTKSKFLALSFIVNQGKVSKEIRNANYGEYTFQENDRYVRAMLFFLEGMVLTNAIYF